MGKGDVVDARSRARIEERFRRDWGVELPESIFRFRAFLDALGPRELRALRDAELTTMGVLDLFDDPDGQPIAGIDVRVHGRYYRDPPEFLTFLHGGSDGLHYGLWFDDGRTWGGVGSYYNNDGGGIDRSAGTPLEAVRLVIERVWRDLDDYGPDEVLDWDERRTDLTLLRRALTAFETADRPETDVAYIHAYASRHPPVDPDRITTLDGGGALVTGETALGRPPHNGADDYRFGQYMYASFDDAEALAESVAQARSRCAAGDPAEALVLGRDLHWASHGDPVREAYAAELLAAAYHALDRPNLAAIAAAHHRHRDLAKVEVLEPRKRG
ncbi:ADP-ribosylation family protein [Embleya sp. NPDC005575]|uniref:ADP-ribosylation family protein n=1 Tax=Embleya sp. NPDC005575 TaxID=3156892 RepID=UPI0033B54FF8